MCSTSLEHPARRVPHAPDATPAVTVQVMARLRAACKAAILAASMLMPQIGPFCTHQPRSAERQQCVQIGGDARVARDQGRSLTAIDVSARGDSERRLGATGPCAG